MSAGGAILIVWTDIPAEIEDDFNSWYDREHLPDRVGRLPGFLRGRRYVNSVPAGAPKYLTYYDLSGAEVMQSDAHKVLRKERPLRDRIFVPQFRNTLKGICDVVCRTGDAVAGGDHLVFLPVAASPESGHAECGAGEQRFAQHVCSDLLPRLAALSGVTSAVFARRNTAVMQASSAGDDRAGDRYIDNLIAVEAASAEAAARAAAQLAQRLFESGAVASHTAAPCVLRYLSGMAAC